MAELQAAYEPLAEIGSPDPVIDIRDTPENGTQSLLPPRLVADLGTEDAPEQPPPEMIGMYYLG